MTNSLKEARNQVSWTQAQLAEKVQVSRQTIISIENNRYTPSVLLALKLSWALGKPVEALFAIGEDDFC
ncbi:MAG: helix-turn-helix transcriptional regulator [Chitinophagaceae bacterium]|nr:helix-turn-helix transcriptional regulator [Chitinophagaceae bacterium]